MEKQHSAEERFKALSQAWNSLFGLAILQYFVNTVVLRITLEKDLLHRPFTVDEKINSVILLLAISFIISFVGRFTGNSPIAVILFFTLVLFTFRKIINHKVEKFFNGQKIALNAIFNQWKAEKEKFEDIYDLGNGCAYYAKYEHSAKEISNYLNSSNCKPPYQSLGFMLEEAKRSYEHKFLNNGDINLKKDLEKVDALRK